MRRDKADIQKAEIIKLGEIANASAGIALNDSSLVNIMRALLNYAGTFEMQYGVNILEAKTTDIFEDTMLTGPSLPALLLPMSTTCGS